MEKTAAVIRGVQEVFDGQDPQEKARKPLGYLAAHLVTATKGDLLAKGLEFCKAAAALLDELEGSDV